MEASSAATTSCPVGWPVISRTASVAISSGVMNSISPSEVIASNSSGEKRPFSPESRYTPVSVSPVSRQSDPSPKSRRPSPAAKASSTGAARSESTRPIGCPRHTTSPARIAFHEMAAVGLISLTAGAPGVRAIR